MEDKLTELINIVSKKFSTTITSISKKSDWNINFPIPLQLDKRFEYEIGMMFFSVYNTVFNITKDNNSIFFTKAEGLSEIKIDPGAREIKNINSYLQNKIGKDLISIEADTSTSKCIMINKVEIKMGTLGKVLGFDQKIYKPGKHESQNKINITNILTINIQCSIADGGYLTCGDQASASNTIHTFPAYNVPSGYKYVEQRKPPIYFPVSTKNIEKINIKITDQDGNLIYFNDENIIISLHLKQV